MRRVIGVLRWVALYTLLAIAATWPLVLHLDEATSDPGDPLLLAWTLHYDWQATLQHPLTLFEAPLLYPSKLALGFSEHVYGIALLCFPLFAAGLSVLTVYNLAMLGGFITSGLAAHLLARVVGASRVASFAAGAFFMLVPFRFLHLSHLQHVWSAWIPLMLALLILWFRRPRTSVAALFAAAFLMNGLTNIHYLLFGGFTVVITGIVLQAWHKRSVRELVTLLIPLSVASLILLPFLTPYQSVRKMYGMVREPAEIRYFSATWIDWLRPVWSNALWGETKLGLDGKAERALFPGLAVVILSFGLLLPRERSRGVLRFLDVFILLGVLATIASVIDGGVHLQYAQCKSVGWRGYSTPMFLTVVAILVRCWIRFPWSEDAAAAPRSLREGVSASSFPPELWLALLWVAIGVIGSLGLNGFLHDFLYGRVEAFRALRVPARWAIIAYTGLSITAALGLDAWLRRSTRRWLTAGLLFLCLLFELRNPQRWYLVDAEPQPVHRWIATIPGPAPLIEFPFNDGWSDYAALLNATVHGKQFVNGISGFEPPFHRAVWTAFESKQPSRVLELLERAGVQLIVVHDDQLGVQRERVRTILTSALVDGRVRLLARFEEGVSGAWVFAIARNLPLERERTLRLPSAETRRMLVDAFSADLTLPQSKPFGYVDNPHAGDEISGRFLISGWALSKHGIRSVRAHFHNRAETIELPLGAYPALHRRFSFVPPSEKEMFSLWIARVPKLDHGWTDLEIEAEDNAGAKTRLFYGMIRWQADRLVCDNDWEEPELRKLLRRLGAEERFSAIENGASPLTDLQRYVEQRASLTDEAFVADAYATILGRRAEPGAVTDAALRLKRGLPRMDYVREIYNSGEFGDRYLRKRTY